MIFPILIWLIDSLIESHKCKKCNSWISDKDIDIVSIKNKDVFLSITCPACKDNVSIKAQVSDLAKKNEQNIDIKTLKEEINSHSSIEDLLK